MTESDNSNFGWADELPYAVTVCDEQGKIVYMNDRSVKTFASSGGLTLVGQSLMDCHPEPARTRLRELLANQGTNVYTIEKLGIRKMIYQAPWYRDGRFAGLVELSLPLPETIPHFVRKPA